MAALAVCSTLLVLAVTSPVTWAQCSPGNNCEAPACRCWDDPGAPGGLDPVQTPQMVLISFAYAVNKANSGLYTSLMEGVTNPNSCPAGATFFVQRTNTDMEEVKTLFDTGHEIGVSTNDGTIPGNGQDWKNSVADVKAMLEDGGIPQQDIQGFRSPELFVGGNDQFEALATSGLSYDSSCVSLQFKSRDSLLWPYTYDFVDDTPVCSIGNDPEQAYKGIWQFLIADLEYKGQVCATPSSCSALLKDSQEVFDFLYESFLKHYDERRTAFILYIDPLWLTVDYQFDGTKQFLQFIQSGFDDTWILTNRQALAWIQDPVPSANISDFTPWQCS